MDMIRLRDSFGPVREDMDIVTAPRLDLGEGRDGRRVATDDGWELPRHMEDSHVGRGFPRTDIKLSGQECRGKRRSSRPPPRGTPPPPVLFRAAESAPS